MDPKDDVAAYNVGVCLERLRFFNDAAKWYEETLRRNPNRTNASDLRRRIVSLRQ